MSTSRSMCVSSVKVYSRKDKKIIGESEKSCLDGRLFLACVLRRKSLQHCQTGTGNTGGEPVRHMPLGRLSFIINFSFSPLHF